MVNQKIDKDKLTKYWIEGAQDDFDTMMAMYNTNRYNWSLFIGHLMIEKLLKAYFVNTKDAYPPFIHNLLRLAEKSGIEIDDELKLDLITITAFNINARYDDYKMSFKNKCTPEYTSAWIKKIKKIRLWILDMIQIQ